MAVVLKWKHQQETYEAMLENIERTRKAAYIYPPACGKSFPSLKYLEDYILPNQGKRVLYLAPRTSVLKQFKTYIKEIILGDPDANLEIKLKNWHFLTFSKLKYLNISKTKVDIIIIDEAHEIGDNILKRYFEELLENNPDAIKIGFTATPERTDGINVIERYFEGNVVYELSPLEALTGKKTGEKVLKPSKYIKIKKQGKQILIDEYSKKIDALPNGERKDKLRKQLSKYTKAEDIDIIKDPLSASLELKQTFTENMEKEGTYIIFCKDEADLKRTLTEAPDLFSGVNEEIYIDYVFSGGKDSQSSLRKSRKANEETLHNFINPNSEMKGKLKLILAVDWLNAGVHFPNVSGIIMLRPTDSPVLYIQQNGRGYVTTDSERETVIIDACNNWLRYFKHLRNYFGKIETKTGNPKKNYLYEYLGLAAEEITLLELFETIDREYIDSRDKFERFQIWMEEHKNPETGEYVRPNSYISKDGRAKIAEEMTREENEEVINAIWWNRSKEKSILKQYLGIDLEDIPEKYQEIIRICRKYGLEESIKEDYFFRLQKWISEHKDLETGEYRIPRRTIRDIKDPKAAREERNNRSWWDKSEEKMILKQYLGIALNDIPEEHKEIVRICRELGLESTVIQIDYFKRFIEWVENHRNPETGECILPKENRHIKNRTDELKSESDNSTWWRISKEKKVLLKYIGVPLDEIPKEDKSIVEICRNLGIEEAMKEIDYFKIVKDWMEEHKNLETGEYIIPRKGIKEKQERLRYTDLTSEQKKEVNARNAWEHSKERAILINYKDVELENIPLEYKEIVELCRKMGLESTIEEKENPLERLKNWIETNKDSETGTYKKPRNGIKINGKKLIKDEMTKEQQEEVTNGAWLTRQIAKYKDITEEEFIELSSEEQDIILTISRYGFDIKSQIFQKLKGCVYKYVSTNEEVRTELDRIVSRYQEQTVARV